MISNQIELFIYGYCEIVEDDMKGVLKEIFKNSIATTTGFSVLHILSNDFSFKKDYFQNNFLKRTRSFKNKYIY